jgi:short-subunit dehydrogenase
VTRARPWRTALVTGASSGIGRALSIELARCGVEELVLVARRQQKLEETAALCRDAGAKARAVTLDVGETERTVGVLRELDAACGGLELVVANAGVGASPGVRPYAWEAMASALHVNFCGAAATLTAVLPAMVDRGAGHVVAIGSLASYGALPGSAAYCAPKAGLSMLMDCLSLDLRGTGVSATHVRLGFVETPMVKASTHPMPQLMRPDDAARRVVLALAARPAEIVLPRALGLATRALAALPRSVRSAALGSKRARGL